MKPLHRHRTCPVCNLLERDCQCTVSLQAVRQWMLAEPDEKCGKSFLKLQACMRAIDDKVSAE